MKGLHPTPNTPWPIGQKVLFRFVVAYFLLYALPFPISSVPFLSPVNQLYSSFWDVLVPWVGDSILGISYPITVKPNGSGDTTYNYVQLFIMFTIAFAATLFWSVLDRKRNEYNTLLKFFTTYIRYYLAFVLFTYGFVKVIQLQFPFPNFERLMKPFGDASPMGLAWRFMGYSYAYNIFTGLGEIVGGLLLLFRKTTTLGALVSFAVMLNIVMINFCFDVPVKLFSSHLLLMAAFLILLDAPRFLNYFVLNRATKPRQIDPYFENRTVNIGLLILKGLIIGGILWHHIDGAFERQKTYGSKRPTPPLYGIYEVQQFVKNNDTIPPLITESSRWRNLIVDWPGSCSVRYMNDEFIRYAFQADTIKQTIQTYSFQDTSYKATMHYHWQDSSLLVLEGEFRRDRVRIELTPFDIQQFELVSRKFNWINEYPYHR